MAAWYDKYAKHRTWPAKDPTFPYDPPPVAMILRALRVRKGLSIRKVGLRAGRSSHTVTRLERGVMQTPKWSTIVAIARGVGVSLDELHEFEQALIQRLQGENRLHVRAGSPRTVKREWVEDYWKWVEEGLSVAEMCRRKREQLGLPPTPTGRPEKVSEDEVDDEDEVAGDAGGAGLGTIDDLPIEWGGLSGGMD